jgi:hypothetical protein
MKQFVILLCLFVLSTISPVLGQKISETNLELGLNKTSSPKQHQYWGDDPSPTYLNFKVTKSWYKNDRWFSLRKEVGLNFQYSNINLSNGGLGASNHYTGNIVSLFTDLCIQARFRIDSTFAFGIGPEAEILMIGNNNLYKSYYTMFNYPENVCGDEQIKGFNRDYFNQPTFGIKLSLFNTNISNKVMIGLNISYLWTKSEYSNFYAANYAKISFFIGLHHDKLKSVE